TSSNIRVFASIGRSNRTTGLGKKITEKSFIFMTDNSFDFRESSLHCLQKFFQAVDSKTFTAAFSIRKLNTSSKQCRQYINERSSRLQQLVVRINKRILFCKTSHQLEYSYAKKNKAVDASQMNNSPVLKKSTQFIDIAGKRLSRRNRIDNIDLYTFSN
ncbi:biogenesis of lysosome-related organelles complex1 subunit KXD1, partial [Striga asiatica]